MEIDAVNNAQSFTGFKITNKTKQGAAKLIEDISSRFANKETRAEEFQKYQADIVERLQNDVIKPLKNVKAEVEYNDGRIFVRNADGTKTVEIDRGKVAPLHPNEYTIVQYPTKGTGADCCVKVDYGTRASAEQAAKEVQWNALHDLLCAKEIAKHFDSVDAKKVLAETARTTYQKGLDSLADDLLNSL
ncbi:MAG: hypothetical protein NC191_02275 [Muribaculaceae bacterium]|nr:hypothetical protein [Muribaculaceae bacterium]